MILATDATSEWVGTTIVVVAAGAVVIGGAVGAIWYWRRRAAARAQARCGQCGYVVTGLPTFTCPECGSDLRKVGITRETPAEAARAGSARDAVRLVLLLAAWTAVYGALYACIGTGSYPQRPWDSTNRPVAYGVVDGFFWPYQGRSTHTVTLEPRSAAYRRVTVTEQREARFHGWRHAPELRWTGDCSAAGLTRFAISLQLDTLNGRSATMEVDPKTLGWRYDDPETPGKSFAGAPLDGAAVWGWMLRNGVDQPNPNIKEEAETIADLIARSVNSGPIGGKAAPWATGRLERIAAQQRDATPDGINAYQFATTRGTASDVYGPAWSIYWLSIPFGLGVYTYGANGIFGRFRRRVSGAKAATAPAAAPAVAPTALPNEAERRPRSRTLTILFADLKGYTARTAAASRDGLRAVLAKNRQIVEGAVAATDGTVVKTIGDAHLITFESATDAILAGLEIQRAAGRHNANVDAAQHLEYRIGVCTGEVTLESGDVFGTAVNVAARAQALAGPGQVLFTESTYHAMNPAEIPHEDIGPHELKGIAAPVRLFRALGDAGAV